MTVSSHLNLFASDDNSVKALDIDATASQTSVDGVKIHFANAVSVANAVNGTIDDLGTKVYALETAIASGNAGSAAASALVQTNLTAYESANNATVSALSATVTQNKSISDQNHIFDAAARQQLDDDLTALISAETTARTSAISGLSQTLSTEISNRTSAIASVLLSASSYETSNNAALQTERGRIDAILASADVSLDTFKEVSDFFSNADTTTLNTIATLQAQVTALQATVDALVDGS